MSGFPCGIPLTQPQQGRDRRATNWLRVWEPPLGTAVRICWCYIALLGLRLRDAWAALRSPANSLTFSGFNGNYHETPKGKKAKGMAGSHQEKENQPIRAALIVFVSNLFPQPPHGPPMGGHWHSDESCSTYLMAARSLAKNSALDCTTWTFASPS